MSARESLKWAPFHFFEWRDRTRCWPGPCPKINEWHGGGDFFLLWENVRGFLRRCISSAKALWRISGQGGKTYGEGGEKKREGE